MIPPARAAIPLWATLAGAVLVAADAEAGFRFVEAGSFAAGPDPAGMAVVDVDHDEYGGPFHISVSLGLGNGQFQPGVLYVVGTCPTSVSAADLNHDGAIDLVVDNFEGANVSVLLGNGDGTFRPRTDFPASMRPLSNVLADFDRDGHLDVASVDPVADVVVILKGFGDGRFGPSAAFAVGDYPVSLVAGDFNRDGNPDVAVANGGSGSISVLAGQGDGTFAAAVDYPLAPSGSGASSPNSIAAADLDHDGNPDLAVVDMGRDSIGLFRGGPDGHFEPVQAIAVAAQPTTVATADFNGDGSADLAVLHYGSGTFRPLLNDGIFGDSFD